MLTACFPRLFINKKANSKDNEFEFLFGIVGFWFCRNTTDAVGRQGVFLGNKVPLQHSVSHFGDLNTLRGV